MRGFISRWAHHHLLIVGVLLAVQGGSSWAQPLEDSRGRWHERVQLVWDEATQQLVRQRVRVWSDHLGSDLEFYWEPALGFVSQADPIAGTGSLTWRVAGSASYDAKSVVNVYRGELRDGRPHGPGSFETRSGQRYEGAWENGVPHGRGTLRYENGDEYRGDFVAGKPHGQGAHVRATGDIYEGGFKLGQRHGHGTLTLPGALTRSSTWVDGHEVVASGQPLLVQWGGSSNPFENSNSSAAITLAVTTDQRKNAEVRRVLDFIVPITYTHQITAGEVTILPDDQKLLSYWKRDGVMYDRVSLPDNAYADEEGLKYKTPAFLRIALQNATAANVELRQLYLDIAASTTEPLPFLSVQHGMAEEGPDCGAEARKLDPTFTFHNEGWSNVGPATLSFSFSLRAEQNVSPQKFSQQLRGFKDTSKVSIATELQSMGLDVAQLQSWHFKCPSYAKLKSCQTEALQRARLGQLKPYAYFGGAFGTQLGTTVAGSMTYAWQNAKGGQEKGTAKFKAHIHLASIEVEVPAECGAGVPEDPKAGVPVLVLSLDKSGYKLSYPLRGKVSVGQRPREFTLGLTATKSSHHAFRVVAEFADGKRKVSQPIKLTYFKPRIAPPPQ